MKNPKISVLIPCFNEERYITNSLNSIINQDYKGEIEIIIADGHSTDKTREIVKQLQKVKIKNREIILIDNPKKSTAVGRNICLFKATGKYSQNFSAHMFLAQKDILTKFVKELENQPEKVICVGTNPASPKKQNFIQKISSILFQTYLAGAKNLYQNKKVKSKTFVDGLTIGMYRTEQLKKEGGFDPKFWVNQDGELHYRLTKLRNYKLLLIPNIIINQAKRSSLKKLIKQMFRYGQGMMLRFYKYPKSLHPFQLGPALFTVYLLFALISLININSLTTLFLSGLALYGLIAILSTAFSTRNLLYIILSPIFFLVMHIAYGTGTIVGLFKPQITKSE